MLFLIVGAIAALAAYAYFSDVGEPDDRPPYEPSRPSHREEREWQSGKVDAPVVDGAALRAKANEERELMNSSKQQSREAYERRDHARGKALKEQTRRHESKMKIFNAQASASIYEENNRGLAPNEVDLHRLYVDEAIAYSDKAIERARRRGYSEIRLIVGKGTHSERGVSKLRPKIQDHVRNIGIPIEVDPKNPGVLIAQVGGR